MSLVFINCTAETLTPANSGAICTWVWELCREAEYDGIHPWIITRSSVYPQYSKERVLYLDYPAWQGSRVKDRLFKLQQRLLGWQHVRHRAWALRVAETLERENLIRFPWVLSNDPELAVWLRNWFPEAKIFHVHQNNNISPEWFRKRFAASVNANMACSRFCAQWNEDYFGFSRGQVKTLFNGVDERAFSPSAPIDVEHPIVNFVGRVDPTKGTDLVFKAALKVAEKTKGFGVQIIGRKLFDRDVDDDYTRELGVLAEELKKKGVQTDFVGWIPRASLPSAIRRAQIHVMPSRWEEPFGMSLTEGMACGLATIASRSGGISEALGDAGLLFDRDDVSALACHIEALVMNKNLRKDYGRKARERVLEALTWKHTWQMLKGVVEIELDEKVRRI